MTDTTKHAQSVSEAQATFDSAMARLEALGAEMEAARLALDAARDILRDAKERADADLPRALMTATAWRGGKTAHAVVVVKRTDKTITVRFPGRDGTERNFRKIASGAWKEYPAPKGSLRTAYTLEIEA